MDQFLQQQSEFGAEDSSGVFTLNPEQARSKMQAAQFAEPGWYILKLVQAAVSAGANRLMVTISSDSLTVNFVMANPRVLEAKTVVPAILALPGLPESPLRHLAVGLNGACQEGFREVRWQTAGGSVVITEDSLAFDEENGSELPCFTVTKKRSLLRSFFGTQFTEEYAALSSRCLFAPLDIFVDTRPIMRPTRDRFQSCSGTSFGLPHPYYLLESTLPGKGLRLLRPEFEYYERLPEGARWIWRGADSGLPLLLDYSVKSEVFHVNAVMGVVPATEGTGHVTFVKDGVTLLRWYGDLGHPRVALVADGSHLSVDLSEYQAVENQAFLSSLEELKGWVQDRTESLQPSELRSALQAGGVSEVELDQEVDEIHHWLRFHKRFDAPTTYRATSANIGSEPLPGEQVILSLPSVKRFTLWVHFDCWAVATNERLIFWNEKHPKHSWAMTWEQVAQREMAPLYNSDLQFKLDGEPTLELAHNSAEEKEQMITVIMANTQIYGGPTRL